MEGTIYNLYSVRQTSSVGSKGWHVELLQSWAVNLKHLSYILFLDQINVRFTHSVKATHANLQHFPSPPKYKRFNNKGL